MSLKKIIGLVSVAALGGVSIYGMGCSSSSPAGNPGGGTDAGKDTGTKADSSVADTGGGGDTSPGDDSGGDAGMTCSAGTAFTPTTWAPPTPLHQGACTAAEITAWTTSQSMTTGLGMSGNAACDACIVTPVTAAAHGPAITATMGSTTILVEANFGGCVANLDGMKAAGSCGNSVDTENDCIGQECGGCSDFQTTNGKTGPTADCITAVFAMGGPCASQGISTMACLTEVQGATDMPCISTFAALLTEWCGGTATTDGGTEGGPTEAGADANEQ
jgi:hypothetical protein